jgi:hypothetical protein
LSSSIRRSERGSLMAIFDHEAAATYAEVDVAPWS